jgi:hypothetical protein
LVENFVRISDERYDTHARSLGDFLCALWPFAYASYNGAKPKLKGFGYCRVIGRNEGEDLIEVIKRFGGIHHLHVGRYFSKTRLT